jgi:hypothetical protein
MPVPPVGRERLLIPVGMIAEPTLVRLSDRDSARIVVVDGVSSGVLVNRHQGETMTRTVTITVSVPLRTVTVWVWVPAAKDVIPELGKIPKLVAVAGKFRNVPSHDPPVVSAQGLLSCVVQVPVPPEIVTV